MIFKLSKDIKFSYFYKKLNILSLLFFILSILILLFNGLNLGVDFKGGTLIEVRTENSLVRIAEIRQSFLKMNLGDITVKKFGKENDYLVKIEATKSDDENFIKSINDKLSTDLGSNVNFRRVENVGPKVSSELLRAGLLAISLSLAAMLFYIWIRFEWQFGIGAVLALLHDVLTTIGLFSILNLEFNLAIVAAILTIAGYSINDTVVVYDRIRENLRKFRKEDVPSIINMSVNQTLSRTTMTSLTTLLALIVLFYFGGEVIHGFVFAMIWGVFIGTYSSIFIASPLLNIFRLGGSEVRNDEKK